jgi:DNA-binding MarR family transcriptional regulator
MKPEHSVQTEPVSKARLRLWLQLLKLSSGIEGELRRRLRDRHDTTLPRFDVMAALARHRDGLKMSDLSRYLKVSNGNVTGIVDRLVEEGLALRVAVPGDRRANLARLTPKGEATFTEFATQHEAWIDELLAPLSDTETQTLMGLLKKAMTQEARHGTE